ncbi:hypothetical protein SAMN05444287_1221 [Octadecabacter temperatus]|nr:hypothetical protein SAMN05444287_1221 [Octadecabacter temperatus]
MSIDRGSDRRGGELAQALLLTIACTLRTGLGNAAPRTYSYY